MLRIYEKKFRTIAEEVEEEWEMFGLSNGIYYDYAKEILRRYVSRHLNKVALTKKGKT